MSTFFTVDRRGILHQDQILNLTIHNDIKIHWNNGVPEFDLLYEDGRQEDELQAHVNKLFANGVSTHGNQYFLDGQSYTSVTSPFIELLFEYVRRSYFAEKPSRFESFFACESLEQARAFRAKYGNGTIWKVECDDAFRADMSLLTIEQESILLTSYSAHRYWSGLADFRGPSFWEYLLTPPVHVLKRVEGIDLSGLDFSGSDLRGVKFDDDTLWPDEVKKRFENKQ